MKRSFTRTVVLTLACAVGCSSVSSCSNMSDDTLTMTQGTAIGAAGGAAIGAGMGALAGLAIGGDSTSTLIGTAIGGGIGLIAGAIAGNCWAASVVDEKHEFASQEARINANIKQVKTRISDVKRTNYTLEREIASLRATRNADKERIKTIRANVERRREILDKDIKTAQAALSRGNTDRDQELRAEVEQLKQQRSTMMAHMSTLSTLARTY